MPTKKSKKSIPSVFTTAAHDSRQSAKTSRQKSAAASSDSAQEALESLTPRLLALPQSAVSQPRTDVRMAASFVLAEIVPRVNAVAERLRSLPAAEFDFSAVADLKPGALACMASQAQLAASSAQTATVRLPADLLDEATALKVRMLKVCAHQFAEDERLGSEIADIRAGTGYLDLAEDLLRLMALYKSEATTLALDGRYYDRKDGARAGTLSERIMGELRHTPTANVARDLTWRAYAFLAVRYEEVASACRFLERSSDGEKHFPPLRAATVQGRRRSRTQDAPSTSPSPLPQPEQPAANS